MRSTFDTILIDASKVSYCGGVVGCTSRIYNTTRDSINNNNVFVNKNNNTRSKNITPVGLYTREGSKSHAESENHANIDNNTRRRASKVAKTASHEVDDYIGAEERAGMVLEVLRRNGLTDGFVAYTDGSCWNSDPNRSGGAAYVVLDNHGRIYRSAHKGFRGTSNNRMEMFAIISAVASVPKGSSIVVMTDSQYSIRAFTNGGTKNHDLIELFDKYGTDRDVSLEWVRGHDGTPLNEWCDHWAGVEYRAMSDAVKNCKHGG